MGVWGFYFLAKLYLYFRGFIHLDFILNLLFLIFLVIPISKQFKFYRSLTTVKSFLGVMFGLLLLWHDSWFPPLWDALTFVSQQGLPSKEYLYRFLSGFFSPWEAAVLISILLLYIMIHNRIRLTPVIVVLLLIVPLREFGKPTGEMDKYLAAFYLSESKRVVHFEKPKTDHPNFDIVILHVCSLSWDDLKGIGIDREDSFFKQFDYVFTDFNSATPYSNPSAIRLLRADCGQRSQNKLFTAASDPNECYLFDSLRLQGYETYFTFNHDGKYYNFAEEVRTRGHLDAPIFPADLPIQAYNFDDSPIFDDYSVLTKWWTIRQASESNGAAVYYNTVSLHDGAYWAGDKKGKERDRAKQYKEFVQKLFGDVTGFINLVAASGRNAVILFVPEHGMALRGTNFQPAGLREIPLPQITIVPVAIKLIGKGYDRAQHESLIISKPTSYLSLSYLLAAFLKQNPFGSGGSVPMDIIENIPTTDFVSETESARVVKKDEDYFLYDKQKKWIKLSNTVQ